MNLNAREITNRFTSSWMDTISYYQELIDRSPEFENRTVMYMYLQKLKKQGNDKYFRIQPVMEDVLICRSVEPGLRADQKHIRITVMDNSFQLALRDGNKMYRSCTVKDLEDDRVTNLLLMLKDIPAD